MSLQLFRDFCKCISQTEIQRLKLTMQYCLVQKVSVELALLAPNGVFNKKIHEMFPDWISAALVSVLFNSRLCFPVAVAVQLGHRLGQHAQRAVHDAAAPVRPPFRQRVAH
jgi:hypothetical protein